MISPIGRARLYRCYDRATSYFSGERVGDHVCAVREGVPQGFEDMMRRVPDVSKLERAIGFRPKRALDEIIRDVIEDQRSRLFAGR